MALVVSNVGTSANPDINSSTDATSYDGTSWTPAADMQMCFVYSRVSPGTPNEPIISGNSLTWVSIATVTASTHRLTLLAAETAGSSSGITTISFDGQTQVGCCASFMKAADADLTAGVAGAFVQTVTNNGTGTTASCNLAAAGSATNVMIGASGHQANEAVTPPATWTEMDELLGATPSRSVQSQQRNPAETTNHSSTFATSSAWLAIAAEVKEFVVATPRDLRRIVVRSQARHRASRW